MDTLLSEQAQLCTGVSIVFLERLEPIPVPTDTLGGLRIIAGKRELLTSKTNATTGSTAYHRSDQNWEKIRQKEGEEVLMLIYWFFFSLFKR